MRRRSLPPETPHADTSGDGFRNYGLRPSRRNRHRQPGIRKPVGVGVDASGVGSRQARPVLRSRLLRRVDNLRNSRLGNLRYVRGA